MKENTLKIDHLTVGFFAGAVVSYMLLSSSFIGNESAFMLIIFNFLFILLTFPLGGKLTMKLLMLLIGNIIGLLWNSLFSSFTHILAYHFGEIFSNLYIITNPFLNLVWIVSFWSITLTALAKSEKRGT